MATTTAPHPYKGDSRFVESGRAGALKRWGGKRLVRLDSLDPRVRAAVLALVAADEAAGRKAPAAITASAQEVRDASHATPTRAA